MQQILKKKNTEQLHVYSYIKAIFKHLESKMGRCFVTIKLILVISKYI